VARSDGVGAIDVRVSVLYSYAAAQGLHGVQVILVGADGEPPRLMGRWVYERKRGDVLRLKVRRDEHEISREFPLGEMKETVYGVFEDPGASEKARNIREGLLRGETASARRR